MKLVEANIAAAICFNDSRKMLTGVLAPANSRYLNLKIARLINRLVEHLPRLINVEFL